MNDDEARANGPVLNLPRYFPAAITNLSNKLSRGASALYRKHFGVGIIEWRVMSQLAIEPGVTASRICAVIGLNKAAVSRSVAFMHARGLVRSRASRDGRQQLLALTASGRALHDRIIAIALERERRLLATLTDEERELLLGLLHRVQENLEAVDAPFEMLATARPRRRRRVSKPE